MLAPLLGSNGGGSGGGVQRVYDNVEVTGTTAGTTTSTLNYGINVIETATLTDFCARLPLAKKGWFVYVINNSALPIVLYPSAEGGSINGVINGSAVIPNDSHVYQFICWENPLPGAWTWTAPATNQYDSGDITSNIASTTIEVTAINNAVQTPTTAGTTYTPSAPDNPSLLGNLPRFGIFPNSGGTSDVCIYLPTPKWRQITKIKFYTNMLGTPPNTPYFDLRERSILQAYSVATGAKVQTIGSDSGMGISKSLTKVVPGTPPAGTLAPFIGDPGTRWDEQDFSTILPNGGGEWGIQYQGQTTVLGTLCDMYMIRYWSVVFKPGSAFTGVKWRFFLEYN